MRQRLRRTSYLIKFKLLKHLLLLLALLLGLHNSNILLTERWMLAMLRVQSLLTLLLCGLLVHLQRLKIDNTTIGLFRHEARRVGQIGLGVWTTITDHAYVVPLI